jgi:hypothetical protein
MFISQMQYNMGLVQLRMKRFTEAEKELTKCEVEQGSKRYQ